MVKQIIANPIVWTAVISWAIAQGIKIIIDWIKDKKFNKSRLYGTGGMPSSHSAFVTSLATAVGIKEGFETTYFAIALALSLIVMYDAQGIRRQAGKQAAVLNDLLRRTQGAENTANQDLKELLGHKPIEVAVGALLGILVAVVLHLGQFI